MGNLVNSFSKDNCDDRRILKGGLALSQETWTTEALSSQLGTTTTSLRRRITLWQSHGLLKEDPADVWTLHEDRPLSGGAVLSAAGAKSGQVFTLDPDDEVEPATATAQDLREEGERRSICIGFWTGN